MSLNFRERTGSMVVALALVIAATAQGATVYWFESNYAAPQLLCASDTGTGKTGIAVTVGSVPQALAFDQVNHRVLWTELSYANAGIRSSGPGLAGDTATLIPSLSALRGIWVDRSLGKLYWVSSNLATGPAIQRANTNGSTVEVLRNFGASSPDVPWSIVVDSASQAMFWTNYDTGSIETSAATASASAQTVVRGLNGPAGLAIDPDSSLLFWSEAGANTISKCHYDGSGKTVIVSGLNRPGAIGIDKVLRRVFWVEAGAMAVKSCGFDGSGIRTVATTASLPTGILVVHDTTSLPVPPVLAAPSNGARNQAVSLSLSWGSVATAISYSVQVSTDVNFGSTVFGQQGISANSQAVGGLANSTNYYWRANASSKVGTGAWATAWSFTTIVAVPGAPALAAPSNGAPGQAIALSLSWSSVSTALSYGFRISTNSNFGSTIAQQAGLTAQSVSLNGLVNNTADYWEVDAANLAGTGSWSGAWSFTTLLATPVPASPANGAIGQTASLTINWGSVAGATSYSLLVSTASTFATTIASQTGITSASLPLSGLAGYTTYYWQVNAINALSTSSWSGVWSFTTATHLAIPLQSGWFMYSLNIHPADSSTNGVFGSLKGFILAMDGSDNLYWPGANLDEIGSIHTGSGYWVLDTLPADTLKLTGAPVNISSNPVSLPASTWNLVSYLPQVSMPVATALASVDSQLVLAMDGASNFYWPAATLNEIGSMTVGNGYYILTNANASLSYPTAGSSAAKLLAAAPAAAKLLNPPALKHFAKRALTGNFAAFLAKQVAFGDKPAADNCEVGAYDTKGNLVGSGTVVNGLTAFAICGKDPASKVKNGCLPSEKLTFKLWNGKTEYPLEVTRGNEPVYSAKTVLTATLAVPAGRLISAFNLSHAYPNPFKGSVNIAFDVPTIAGVSRHAVQIAIFDMKGSLVKQLAKGIYQAGHYEMPWNCNEGREGVSGSSMYIVRMKAANFEKRLKLVRVE